MTISRIGMEGRLVFGPSSQTDSRCQFPQLGLPVRIYPSVTRLIKRRIEESIWSSIFVSRSATYNK
jgi:hypothetical protein